mgnify:CR=1 FL=1
MRDYSKLEWDDLTQEEQTRFKVRYTVLKVTEIITVIGVISILYFILK